MIQYIIKRFDNYKIAVFLSSLSMIFGILREFLIVWLLGFTTNNDKLQLYLSIFYTIGLTIDAMRLTCLNLYSIIPLSRIILSASVIGMPFSVIIGLTISYSTGGLNPLMVFITILGSYLNLIAALLITYKQRNDMFLGAQLINVLPNFVLIPGICICYFFIDQNLIYSIVILTSLIPVVQCLLLLTLPNQPVEISQNSKMSFMASIMTVTRHFSVMLGEQLFQVITRTAFFSYGTGYLSLYAMAIRIYSAARFILVDSFIGSKLANWKTKFQNENSYLLKLIELKLLSIFLVVLSLSISLISSDKLLYSTTQIVLILIFGFYFSTLVRIIYFKINHYENNSSLVMSFAMYELMCAMVALLLTKQFNYPILTLLWIGYIAKPFGQLLLLRKRYHGLTLEWK